MASASSALAQNVDRVKKLQACIPRYVLREFAESPGETILTKTVFVEKLVANALLYTVSADNKKFLSIPYKEKFAALAPVGSEALNILLGAGFGWVEDDSGARRLELPSSQFSRHEPVLVAVQEAIAHQRSSTLDMYREHGEKLTQLVQLYFRLVDDRAAAVKSKETEMPNQHGDVTSGSHADRSAHASVATIIATAFRITPNFDQMNIEVQFGGLAECSFAAPDWLDPEWLPQGAEGNVSQLNHSESATTHTKDNIAVATLVQQHVLERQFLSAAMFHPTAGLSRLLPMRTKGDGNCLLHALSLAMWGVHDKGMLLRIALHAMLSDRNPVMSVSEINKSISGSAEDAGVASTAEDSSLSSPLPPRPRQDLNDDVKDMIESEWSNELKCALTANRHLGPIHVLALAHVLRRPIIVYGERSVSAGIDLDMRSANNIRGIYLPFLFDPSVCSRDPLPLYYANSHFCALVGVDDSLPLPGLVPLQEKMVCLQISASNEVSKVVVTEQLPLRFHSASETSLSRDERIHRYLDIQFALAGSSPQELSYHKCARYSRRKTFADLRAQHPLLALHSGELQQVPLSEYIERRNPEIWQNFVDAARVEIRARSLRAQQQEQRAVSSSASSALFPSSATSSSSFAAPSRDGEDSKTGERADSFVGDDSALDFAEQLRVGSSASDLLSMMLFSESSDLSS